MCWKEDTTIYFLLHLLFLRSFTYDIPMIWGSMWLIHPPQICSRREHILSTSNQSNISQFHSLLAHRILPKEYLFIYKREKKRNEVVIGFFIIYHFFAPPTKKHLNLFTHHQTLFHKYISNTLSFQDKIFVLHRNFLRQCYT